MADLANQSKPFIFLGLLIFLVVGCKNRTETLENNFQNMQIDLQNRIQELERIEQQVAKIDLVEEGDFLHEVYFNLKKDISEKELADIIIILKELKTINEAKGIQIGIPKNTGDQRIRTDYDLVLHMSFNNLEDYKIYQNHETHLSVKKRIGNRLVGPPFVYDYEIK